MLANKPHHQPEVINMRIHKMWKTGESKTGGCPAVYSTDRGGYVVQGVKLDPGDRAQLEDLADDEDAVFVPADVLDRFRVL